MLCSDDRTPVLRMSAVGGSLNSAQSFRGIETQVRQAAGSTRHTCDQNHATKKTHQASGRTKSGLGASVINVDETVGGIQEWAANEA